MASGNNAADSVDIGFYGLYDTSGSQDLYAGLFRDANDSGKFKLFKDLQAAPTTTVNVSGTGYAVATLVANIEGALTGNADTVTNGVYTSNNLSVMAATTSAQLAGVISDETGSGALVFGTSPTLTTPALGTPSALVGTNISGTAASLTAGAVTNGVYTSNNLSVMAATTSAQLAGVISDETGSGALVFGTSPTLVTPVLGTPASGTLTNCTFPTLNQNTTGTAAIATTVTVADESSDTTCFPLFVTAAAGNLAPKSGSNLAFNSSSGALTATSFVGDITGDLTGNADTVTNGVYTSNNLSVMAATTSSQLAGVISDETGSGALVFGTSPTLVTPALGTPSALVGTNISGTAANLTAGAVTNGVYTSNNLSAMAATTSAQLAGVISDETGSGALVFATSPTLVTPALGTPASGTLTNCTFPTLNQDTTGTATYATSFTVSANNTNDETMYPIFVDGATGSQGAESDTGFTYNPSTGTVAATVFSGSGADLTTLNGSNISSGTVAAARVATLNQDTTGNAATATALASGVTIGMTGDVVWTSASFDGSGNVTGTATIQADAVHYSMLNDDCISGFGEITTGLAAADEFLYSDAGTLKRVGIDTLATKLLGLASAGTVAQAADHMVFLDGGATGDVIVESIDDFLTAIAGSGISVSSSQLTASGGGGSGTMTTVKSNGSAVGGADIVTLDFSSEFTVGGNS